MHGSEYCKQRICAYRKQRTGVYFKHISLVSFHKEVVLVWKQGILHLCQAYYFKGLAGIVLLERMRTPMRHSFLNTQLARKSMLAL